MDGMCIFRAEFFTVRMIDLSKMDKPRSKIELLSQRHNSTLNPCISAQGAGHL
jgi:hypothetical protein